MLVDWITAKLPYTVCPAFPWRDLMGSTDRIQRFNPATGAITWEKTAWESIRSDSHGVTFRFSADALFVQGSPARSEGDGCNVFGGQAAQSLDLIRCLQIMIAHVGRALGTPLPHAELWHVTRVDVTANLALPSLPDVRVALRTLRDVEGGRYRVSQLAGDTVYWSHSSKLRSGKAYAKGPHLRHLNKLADPGEEKYTEDKIGLADRLLRLELKLGSQFFRELSTRFDLGSWRDISPDFLREQWSGYFARMVGSESVDMNTDLLEKLLALVDAGVIPTKGQARAAYGLWMLIQSVGWEASKAATSKPSWYRNLGHLRAAGLGDADFSAGSVVTLRRKSLLLEPVTCWEDLRAA